MAEHDWKAKIAAAQDAVEKAAALLLEHAEGLGALAMMERHREKPVDLHEASLTPSLYLRDDGASWEHLFSRSAEDSHWDTVKAAVAFAAAREAQRRRWEMPTRLAAQLRQAVEDVVGPDGGPPPLPDKVAEIMGSGHPTVKPAEVHRQAWRDFLVTTTAGRKA